MKSTIDMLKIDNCQRQVNLPLWHLSVKNDNYFDNRIVEQHLKIIFNGCQNIQIKLPGHSMTVIPDKKAAAPLLPAELRSLLRAQS